MGDNNIDPKKCTADFSNIGIDGQFFFFFTARDGKGNQVPEGGAPFGSKMIHSEGEEVKVEIIDNNDGTYKGQFPEVEPGEYTIVVGLLNPNGRVIQDMIRGSPFTVWVGPKPVEATKEPADPSKCFVFGTSARKALVKRKSFFSIAAVDKNGNDLAYGGELFKTKVVAPKGGKLPTIPSTVQDQQNGAYVVSYTPMVVGDYQVEVLLNDKPILGTPFVITVVDGPTDLDVDPTKTIVDFSEISKKDETGAHSIRIEPRNFKDELANVSATFKVKILSWERQEIPSNVRDSGHGYQIIKFVPPADGLYAIFIEHFGQRTEAVKGSPFKIEWKIKSDNLEVVSLQVAPEKAIAPPEETPTPKEPSRAPARPKEQEPKPPQGTLSPLPSSKPPPKPLPQDSFLPKKSPAASSSRVPPKNPPPGAASKWKKSG